MLVVPPPTSTDAFVEQLPSAVAAPRRPRHPDACARGKTYGLALSALSARAALAAKRALRPRSKEFKFAT